VELISCEKDVADCIEGTPTCSTAGCGLKPTCCCFVSVINSDGVKVFQAQNCEIGDTCYEQCGPPSLRATESSAERALAFPDDWALIRFERLSSGLLIPDYLAASSTSYAVDMASTADQDVPPVQMLQPGFSGDFFFHEPRGQHRDLRQIDRLQFRDALSDAVGQRPYNLHDAEWTVEVAVHADGTLQNVRTLIADPPQTEGLLRSALMRLYPQFANPPGEAIIDVLRIKVKDDGRMAVNIAGAYLQRPHQ
jgi:hypothetical protein